MENYYVEFGNGSSVICVKRYEDDSKIEISFSKDDSSIIYNLKNKSVYSQQLYIDVEDGLIVIMFNMGYYLHNDYDVIARDKSLSHFYRIHVNDLV